MGYVIEDMVFENIKRNLERQFLPQPATSGEYINDFGYSGWISDFNLDLILSYAIEEGASDIHIIGGQVVCFSILGDIKKKEMFPVPDEDIMEDLVSAILTNVAYNEYIRNLEYDFNYKIKNGPYIGRRFRANLGKSFGVHQITFRTINDSIPTMFELGITKEVYSLFNNNSGVVILAGATGSGKSTTLASIIRNIQMSKKKKIITIEKPIEYVYPEDGQSLIVQREIPEDCLTFGNGLTSAMRSAPDIILIGEVRNRDEVDELLRSAETGHLSLSTIHSSNNVTTLNRIRSLYSGDEQKRILSTLGDTLRGIVNQVLVKTKDGKGRFAIREVLEVNYDIRKLIAEDRISEIREIQEKSESTMEHLLVNSYIQGKCNLEDAREKAPDPLYFDYILKNKNHTRDELDDFLENY